MEECVYLLLGCYGRKEDGFILCPSTENRILKLDDSLVHANEIWAYLDNLGILDKPMLDTNGIRHLVFNLQNKYDQKIKRLWNEREFRVIERFIHMHKDCGMYSKLIMTVDDLKKPEDDEAERVKIKGTPVVVKEEPQKSNVYFMRARR